MIIERFFWDLNRILTARRSLFAQLHFDSFPAVLESQSFSITLSPVGDPES